MSTIKVDTLQTRSGNTAAVTGAGFVATDQIKGNTTATTVTLPTTTNIGATAIVSASAGSATIIAEGGTVTTNIQQGLGKQWVRLSGAGMAVVDSFNTTSSTDSAQGKAAIAIANDMANTSYACIFGGEDKQDGGGVFVTNINQAVAQATTGYGMVTKKQTASAMSIEDVNQNMACLVCGDLA